MVIIITYAELEPHEIVDHRPTVVHVNESNQQILIDTDPARPVPGTAQVSGRG
jgi:aspartate 1-decarboxylase